MFANSFLTSIESESNSLVAPFSAPLHRNQTTYSVHEACTAFVEHPSFHFWTSVKINGITNLTHKLIFKTWSFPCEKNFAIFCAIHWRVPTFFTTSVLAMLSMFPIKTLPLDSLLILHVESSYLKH